MNGCPLTIYEKECPSLYQGHYEDRIINFSGYDLPSPVVFNILNFLNINDDDSFSLTSKDCYYFANHPVYLKKFDLKNNFPGCLFLAEDWNHYFKLKLKIKPLQIKKVFIILNERCPFSETGEKIWQTHTFLEIPQGFTLSKLVNLQAIPEINNKWVKISQKLLRNYGLKPVEKTHCVLISNQTCLRNKDGFKVEDDWLDGNSWYKVPSVLDATAFMIASRINAYYIKFEPLKKRFISPIYEISTCCQEFVAEKSDPDKMLNRPTSDDTHLFVSMLGYRTIKIVSESINIGSLVLGHPARQFF